MKRVAICAKDVSKIPRLKKIIKDKGLTYVTSNPEFVISLGGDGTYLYCERLYPGIPKILIRDSKVCEKCVSGNDETILDFIRMNAYEIQEVEKLEVFYNGKKLLVINDLILRNEKPYQALRLDVFAGKKVLAKNVIGDGVVIATPFGSSAYYRSIVKETFDKGFSIAFNNPVSDQDPIFFHEETIKVVVVRGPAQLATDNHEKVHSLKEGESVIIKKAKEKAKLISIEGFDD